MNSHILRRLIQQPVKPESETSHSSGMIQTRLVLLSFNHLNAELNPIRHLLALVGARYIVHVSRVRVK